MSSVRTSTCTGQAMKSTSCARCSPNRTTSPSTSSGCSRHPRSVRGQVLPAPSFAPTRHPSCRGSLDSVRQHGVVLSYSVARSSSQARMRTLELASSHANMRNQTARAGMHHSLPHLLPLPPWSCGNHGPKGSGSLPPSPPSGAHSAFITAPHVGSSRSPLSIACKHEPAPTHVRPTPCNTLVFAHRFRPLFFQGGREAARWQSSSSLRRCLLIIHSVWSDGCRQRCNLDGLQINHTGPLGLTHAREQADP